MGTKADLKDTTKDDKKTPEEINEIEVLDQEEETTVPALDPRQEMMQQVVKDSASARAQSKQEFLDDTGFDADELIKQQGQAELGEDDGEVKVVADKSKEPEKTPEVIDKTKHSDNNQIIEHEGDQFLKLKVDGVETEISVTDAIARLQREDKSDHKMWEASQRIKQYDALIVQQQDQQSTPPDDMSDPTVDTKEALKKALTKVYDGDVAEAAEDLSKVLRPVSNPVNVDEIVDRKIAQREDHRDLTSAYDRFISDENFSSITNDPILMGHVNTFTEDLQRDPEFLATKPTYDDFFSEAGKRVVAWIDKISATSKVTTPEKVDARHERKRSLQQRPETRTVRRGPKQEKKPQSNEDIIKGMAAKRGQTNL